MPIEMCHYRLSLRGKPVGTQTLSTLFRGRTAILDVKMQLQGQGPLRQVTINQQSKTHRQQFFSFSFQESQTSPENRNFEVTFDMDAGLVHAGRGNDAAVVPYVKAFEDPLGLLYHLRHLGEAALTKVPMLGKDVTVEYMGEVTLETALGEQAARVYQLHPGRSYVYVGKDEPRPILKLSQRFEGGLLDAQLVRLEETDEAPPEPRRRRRGRRRRRN